MQELFRALGVSMVVRSHPPPHPNLSFNPKPLNSVLEMAEEALSGRHD